MSAGAHGSGQIVRSGDKSLALRLEEQGYDALIGKAA